MKAKFYSTLFALLVSFMALGQYAGEVVYDLRDGGTIVGNQGSTDGKLTLGGTYSHHGDTYGLDLKVNATISIQVDGSTAIRFLGSKHSGLDLKGTASIDGELGTQVGKVTNDLTDTYDFVYSGEATTLTFSTVAATGSDLYVPQITVIPAQAGKDVTSADKNIPYFFDLRDESIYPSGAGNHVEAGLIVIDAGCCNGISLNGSQHGITFKDQNTITLKVAGNSYIRIAGDQYSGGTITASSTTGSFDVETQDHQTSVTYPQGTDGGPWVDFIYAGTAGEVVLTAGGSTNYIPYIEISPIPYDVDLIPWMQKAGTATVNGVDINYTSGIDEDSDPVVTVTRGHVLSTTLEEASVRIDLGGMDLSSFTPTVSGDIESVSIDGSKMTLNLVDAGVSNPEKFTIEVLDGSIIDVLDFGAEQIANTQTEKYKNWLTVDAINAWYNDGRDPAVTPGTSGNVMPETFTSGLFTWTGGSNDRLRTTNETLTRYDQNTKGDFAGRLYINANPAPARKFTVALNKDDELTLWMYAENADGQLHFQFDADPTLQDDIATVPISTVTEVNFVAKASGNYSIFDAAAKPSYFRIYRKDATYVTISGTVDESAASGIPEGYSIVFTNTNGNATSTIVESGNYTVSLPASYSYDLSLTDANGYLVSDGLTLDVTESTSTHNIVVEKVELYTVSGSILGLGTDIDNLTLVYTPDPQENKLFVPEPVIDAGNATYSVELEPNTEYTISGEGVNDYEILLNTITVSGDQTADVDFSAKSTFTVTATIDGLNTTELNALTLIFTNLNEEGYVYSFANGETISLRDGTYSISYSGIDDYPVEMALVSNLKVEGAPVSKTIKFVPVSNWTFDDRDMTGLTSYKGLLFTGNINNQQAKSHLTAKPDATIQIPANVGDIISINYYYSADFSIDGGDPITTNSGTTSEIESVEYAYPGTDAGFVNIVFGTTASTSYITDIFIGAILPYTAEITVGSGKDYETINEALNAVRNMDRSNDERVTLLIDAGNYEEMLVIDIPNITLRNAASMPSIELLNKGVDIADGAVRITGYYGHGYNYYSMGPDYKWNADILAVNKENGYQPVENPGAGSSTYWNSTVIVFGSGFEAENIIFENSFNQYISQKESEDVIEEKSDSKGPRPTTVGSTDVQDRGLVERAAALAIGNNVDKVILNTCRVVGRQDSFYGGKGSRVAIYRGAYMGAVDYIFGGMTAVFYKSDLVMNVSDVSSDASYLTAAQQDAGRGFLMYETTVASAEPGVETASTFRAKPGYFGRPWAPNTSEVVFYNTNVETSDYTGAEDLSLIAPEGWTSSLGGESTMMYEYGTVEESGIDNSANRASWSTVLAEPTLTDGTEITLFNFTKGEDEWDPFALLIDNNNSLASLAVSVGTLDPAFDAEVTAYSVAIPYGTEEVIITALAESEFATVEIGEFDDLPGSATVTVTADDGSTKVYTVNVSVDLPLSVEDKLNNAYGLSVYPNPSEFGTTLSFSLPSSEMVEISIIDFSGKVVRSVMNSRMSEGDNEVHLETNYLNPGIYFCTFNTSNTKQSVTIIVK